ncbi:MAG: NADH-quinone oxidoreductase subunit H [Candidatus Krumholzibacteriia bacterium]
MQSLNTHAGIVFGRVVLMWLLPLLLLPLMIWFERKVSAFIQDRTGPNRAAILGVRLGGVVHTIADVLKLLGKEDVVPAQVHRLYYRLAPLVAIVVAQVLFVIVPFADDLRIGGDHVGMQALQLDVGILWPLAVGAIMVYSVVLAGWASNNKFGTLGGLRAAAQMVSYEVALGFSIMGAIMIYGTLDLNEIVRQQEELLWGWLPRWGLFLQPLGALLFLVAAFAETNRTPFDMAEREAEIVAGFHTEYSGVRFASFFMAEYVHIVVASGLVTTLFLGGWQIPWVSTEMLRENAKATLAVLLSGMLLAGLVCTFLALRWSRRLRVEYAGARRHEGLVLATLFGIVGLVGVVGLVLLPGLALPAWAPSLLGALVQFKAFVVKTLVVALGFIWVRWTLPSFRYDQIMTLGWKQLMPWALVNITVTGIVMLLLGGEGA